METVFKIAGRELEFFMQISRHSDITGTECRMPLSHACVFHLISIMGIVFLHLLLTDVLWAESVWYSWLLWFAESREVLFYGLLWCLRVKAYSQRIFILSFLTISSGVFIYPLTYWLFYSVLQVVNTRYFLEPASVHGLSQLQPISDTVHCQDTWIFSFVFRATSSQ